MLIKVSQVQYAPKLFLKSLNQPEQREIIHTIPLNVRTIPYDRKISTSITYEVDREKVFIKRVESKITDILSDLGGYWSILATVLFLADLLDDVQLYVATDLVAAQESEVKTDELKKDLPKDAGSYSRRISSINQRDIDGIRLGCCSGVKYKIRRMFPFCRLGCCRDSKSEIKIQ